MRGAPVSNSESKSAAEKVGRADIVVFERELWGDKTGTGGQKETLRMFVYMQL